MNSTVDFGNEKVHKILFKLAPPIILAQLIQALYNIVDSLFIGKFDEKGLTALSIVFPLQLLMLSLAVGTGVGLNTLMSHFRGIKLDEKSKLVSGMATPLAIFMYVIFALTSYFIMPLYARLQTSDETILEYVNTYGIIVCVGSIGLFLESMWAKVLQAEGKMIAPMVDQIVGAIVNIVLDPILIFYFNMGIQGAGIATIIGQTVSAIIIARRGFRKSPSIKCYKENLGKVYKLGLPNILMQSAYTLYIFGLNVILAGFSDAAVTTLGLYYKWQSFFFIPIGALQICIVPIISYNFARNDINRCKKILNETLLLGALLMLIGVILFETIPVQLASVFSSDKEVKEISAYAFRFIGLSFIPLVTSLIYPVFFQAVGYTLKSSMLTILRTVILFVPIAYILSLFGLFWFWLVYPITEIITSIVGYIFYKKFIRKNQCYM